MGNLCDQHGEKINSEFMTVFDRLFSRVTLRDASEAVQPNTRHQTSAPRLGVVLLQPRVSYLFHMPHLYCIKSTLFFKET